MVFFCEFLRHFEEGLFTEHLRESASGNKVGQKIFMSHRSVSSVL